MGASAGVSASASTNSTPSVDQSAAASQNARLMALSMGIQGINAVGGAYSQSQAMQAQGAYQRQMGDSNSRLASLQASDAIARGEKNVVIQTAQTRKIVGSQRAAMAAQGIDVNDGSAAEVQSDTAAMGALDALTIRNNAWREAWGYKQQASNYSYQGQFAEMAANNSAKNTLIAGGMSGLSYGLQAGYYASQSGRKKTPNQP